MHKFFHEADAIAEKIEFHVQIKEGEVLLEPVIKQVEEQLEVQATEAAEKEIEKLTK